MSRSSTDGTESTKEYFDKWQDLYALMRQGKSFSGHERNCFFLNMGGKGFADVSAMSGLDFPDDGRGVAVVDWDMDGREDVWISNRNGPRVRLMQNAYPNENDYLALHLEGTTSNRDAIGARVEVQNAGPGPKKLIETLRAGESFLSQSSKWMHFGLGREASIDAVIVHWPGGKAESFEGVEANGRYVLREGSGTAAQWTPPSERAPLVQSTQVAPKPSDSSRIVLAARFPLPKISYLNADLSQGLLKDLLGRGPMLINLWASWCGNCRVELNEFDARREELQRAGLDILTLSVDEPDKRDEANRILDGLDWPFQRGFADIDTASIFGFLPQLIVEQKPGLALPTSFLLDSRGRLAIVYRGPVEVDELLEDVKAIGAYSENQRDLATPFQGQWIGDPSGPRYFAIVRRLRALGQLETAAQYLARVQVGKDFDPAKNPVLTSRLLRSRLDLARDLAEADMDELAIPFFRGATDLMPANPKIFEALGECLLKTGRPDEAAVAFRQAAERSPDSAGAQVKAGVAFLEQGDFEQAFTRFKEAVRIDPELAVAHQNLGILYARRGEVDPALEHMRKAVELNPEGFETNRNLALLLHKNKRGAEAIPFYRKALELQPGNAELIYNLALAQFDQGDREAFDRLYEQLKTLAPPLAERLARKASSQ